MKTNESLSQFLKGIREDGRIGPTHISFICSHSAVCRRTTNAQSDLRFQQRVNGIG